MIGIYKITNKINGKVYIGQSTNTSERWLAHKEVITCDFRANSRHRPLYKDMMRYGLENFSFEVIEECSKEKLNEREIYWIKYYNSYFFNPNSNGYNLTIGGETNKYACSEEEIQQIIDLWREGKSIKEIIEITNRGRWAVLNHLKDKEPSYNPQESQRRQHVNQVHGEKGLYQYDLEGNFIREFNSIKAAGDFMQTDPSLISKAAKGRFRQLKGYIYIFKSEENKEEILARRIKVKKTRPQVLQIDPDTNRVIDIIDNQTAKAKELGGPQHDGTKISSCCRGENQTVYGYRWKYADEVAPELVKIGAIIQ